MTSYNCDVLRSCERWSWLEDRFMYLLLRFQVIVQLYIEHTVQRVNFVREITTELEHCCVHRISLKHVN